MAVELTTRIQLSFGPGKISRNLGLNLYAHPCIAAETGQLPRSPATRRPTMHPVATNPLSRSSSQPGNNPGARRMSYSRSASMLASQTGNIMYNFEKNFERRLDLFTFLLLVYV